MKLFKKIFNFLIDIYSSRQLIFELAKKDFKVKYLGSYLGILWAFVQPCILILIYWFVFQYGFKSPPVEDVPFILWLMCGLIPWFLFSDGLISATNSIIENSYLVKKVVFRVSILPIVKIISVLFINIFFNALLFIMFLLYGYKLSIYNIQVVYFIGLTVVLVLGLSCITSSLVVFVKDVGQILSMLLQFGFWLTPIIWSFDIVPNAYKFIFKLNPMFYIIQGYRDSFINHVWFWEHKNHTLAFSVLIFVVGVVGGFIFKRLRPHFSDVI